MTDISNQRYETIFVTDAELIRRWGVPEKTARRLLREWDAKPHVYGFPQKQKLHGERRHWPSVKDYFARTSQPRMGLSEGSKRHAG